MISIENGSFTFSSCQGYAGEMENAELKDLIPACLVGKQAILFGNLDAIYRFHANIFLKHLESRQDTPHLVGACFVDKVIGERERERER